MAVEQEDRLEIHIDRITADGSGEIHGHADLAVISLPCTCRMVLKTNRQSQKGLTEWR